jgi:hypothetical protein
MKRPNPATGLPFKSGDIREDGRLFNQYRCTKLDKNGFFKEVWLTAESHKKARFDCQSGDTRTISNFSISLVHAAKSRCRGSPSRIKSGRLPTNGKVTITKQWVLDRLENGFCEATGDKLTILPRKNNTASLDRIDANNPDYTPQNCRIVTWQFNNMRGAYTDEEFIAVAEKVKNVKKKSTSSLSISNNREGQNNSQHGTTTLPGAREDDNHTDHHSGAVRGQDADHRAQASSGDGVGRGGTKVVALEPLTRIEDHGQPDAEIIRLDFGGRHISD